MANFASNYLRRKYTEIIMEIRNRLLDKDRNFFVLSICFLNSVYPVQLFFQSHHSFMDRLSNGMSELWTVAVFAVLVSILLPKCFRYIYIFISSVFFTADSFCYLKYNTVLDESLSDSLYNTNLGEVYEYLRQEIDTGYALYIFFFIILVLVLLWFSKVIVLKINSSVYFRKGIILFFLLCFFLSNFFYIFKDRMVYEKSVFRVNSIPYYCILLKNYLYNTDYSKVNGYLDEWSVSNNDLFISEDINEDETQYVVYCIGESYSSHFASAYGYDLKTTPYLDECRNKIIFSHAVAPESYTVGALKRIGMISSGDGREYDDDKFYENGSIADAFRLAGWETCWISNQNYGGAMGSIEKILAERCDKKSFTFKGGFWQGNIPYDEAVLPFIDDEISDGKKMFFIHLMGSHFIPYERYPDSFNFFRPADIEADTENKREFIAWYLNSVLYNDYIMKKIADFFRDKNAVIVYLSDHGELVFNGRNNNDLGRGHKEIDPVVYDVPMIVWFSDIYKEKHGDRLNEIDKIKDDVFYTENISDVIFKAAGIRRKEELSN